MNNIIFVVPFLLVGLIAGTGAGLLGIGGGIIYIPSLFFLLPLIGITDDKIVITAITTSLFTAMFSSGTAFYNHLKLKNVDLKKALLFVAGSVITSTILPRFIIKINPFYPKFILFMVLIAALIKIYFTNDNAGKNKYRLNDYFIVVFGLFVGALSASAGIGGGLIVVPSLTIFFALDFKFAIGTSTLVVFITIISSSLSYWLIGKGGNGLLGFINLFAAIPMIIGAIAGSIYGTKLGRKFSNSTIRGIFSVILIVAIIKVVIEL